MALWWKDFCFVVTRLCQYGTDLRQRRRSKVTNEVGSVSLKWCCRARKTCWRSYLSSESVGWYQGRGLGVFPRKWQTCLFCTTVTGCLWRKYTKVSVLISCILGVTGTNNILSMCRFLHSTVTMPSVQVPLSGAKWWTKLCEDKEQVLIFHGPATVITSHDTGHDKVVTQGWAEGEKVRH